MHEIEVFEHHGIVLSAILYVYVTVVAFLITLPMNESYMYCHPTFTSSTLSLVYFVF